MVGIGMAMQQFTGDPPSAPPPVNPMALKADNAQEELAKAAGLQVTLADVSNVDIVCANEEIYRAVALIVVGPKLKAMEEAGRANATNDFQDVFVEIASKVPGIRILNGCYYFGGLSQMVVMTK